MSLKSKYSDTGKHKHHIIHEKNRQRGKLRKPISKKTKYKKYLRSKQDPNVQSDEAKRVITSNLTVEKANDVNWIPYGDHRNAVEHGSGDIILLLEDENEPNYEANQVKLKFSFFCLCNDYII